MHRLLPRIAVAAVTMSILSASAAWAAPTRTFEPDFLLSRVWNVIDFFAARFAPLAEKDGSLMDPDGRPAQSQGGSQMDPDGKRMTTQSGSQMDPNGKPTEHARPDDGSAMDPNG